MKNLENSTTITYHLKKSKNSTMPNDTGPSGSVKTSPRRQASRNAEPISTQQYLAS